ncbi:glucose-6-phosphate isomerase [Prochlorococcus sp. MIT 1300]|uniref:glucose-6-phosphate isomerase n=1 Tax=Prochlorococcus sp. MIT 1300 TaxID=3096218 RepID=UPI002A765937|nr:glucose-6-phosphate isomerase [Prochlorococcus sp. MIT 1300]
MSFPDFSSGNVQSQWQRYCELLWYHEDLELWLDISRMDINSLTLEELRPSFKEAFKAMEELEKGAVANKDENRQVGHYWLRTPGIAPNSDVTKSIEDGIDQIDSFSKAVLDGTIQSGNGQPFNSVLWIGIGGSGLGPVLMVEALQKNEQGLPFYFVDNVDPQGIAEAITSLGDAITNTLFVVVSKSGGTPEPRIAMEQFRNHLQKVGGNWSSQAVAITMIDSRLDQLAKQENWLETFDLPDWVGGRTSITSAVGLLSGGLIGCNIREFLVGASQMDEATRLPETFKNPAALMAAAWWKAGEGNGIRDMVVLPYKDRLEVFSRYLQQLVMESLGKKYDRSGNVVSQGLAVYGNKGSTDQHAYVQQLRDGIDNFFVTFIEILDDSSHLPILNNESPGDFLSGFLQGTRLALSEGGRQSITITLRSLNSRTLGALIALFERTVGLYAELIDINAYHQPGVEAGKLAAADILSLQERIEQLLSDGVTRSLSNVQQAIECDSIESVFLIIRHLVLNNSEYVIHGSWANPVSLTFTKST